MNYSFRNKYFLLFLSSLLFWFIFSDKTYAAAVDLAIVKDSIPTASTDAPYSGTISYTLDVTNLLATVATNITVTDPLPAGMASPTWTCAVITATGTTSCGTIVGTQVGAVNTAGRNVVVQGTTGRIRITVTGTALPSPNIPSTLSSLATVAVAAPDTEAGGLLANNTSNTINTVVDYEDFGDAPDTYKTLFASNGPRHTVNTNLMLGNFLDSERDGFPASAGADAIGDNTNNNNDEDGLRNPPPLDTAQTSYTITANATTNVGIYVKNITGSNAFLIGWIDFNRNGTFEAGEGSTVLTVATGTQALQTLSWPTIPAGVRTAGVTYIRLRLTTNAITSANFIGLKTDGEIEDYRINMSATGVFSITGKVFIDNISTNSNYNADYDLGEKGLAGVPVTLQNTTTTTCTTQITDSDGNYKFSGLPTSGTTKYMVILNGKNSSACGYPTGVPGGSISGLFGSPPAGYGSVSNNLGGASARPPSRTGELVVGTNDVVNNNFALAPLSLLQNFDSACPVEGFLSEVITRSQASAVNITSNFKVYLSAPTGFSSGLPISIVPFEYNAMGFNTSDAYLYAIRTASTDLVRIDKNGYALSLGEVNGLPLRETVPPAAAPNFNAGSGNPYFAGDYNPFDNLLYVNANATTYLYKINTNTVAVSGSVNLGSLGTDTIADIGFNPTIAPDGLRYAYGTTSQSNSYIYKINPSTGSKSTIPLSSAGQFFAMFLDSNNNIFIEDNTQTLKKIKLNSNQDATTLTTVQNGAGVNLTRSDGARCPFSKITTNDFDFYAPNTTSVLPGATVTYPHKLVSTIPGNVALTINSSEGYIVTVFKDVNANGLFDTIPNLPGPPIPVDTQIDPSNLGDISALPNGELNIIIRFQAPSSVASTIVESTTLTATLTPTPNAGQSFAALDPIIKTLVDITNIAELKGGTLRLEKTVKTFEANGVTLYIDPTGAENGKTAKPGHILEYTLTYTNISGSTLKNIKINDIVPPSTTFVSAGFNAPATGTFTGPTGTAKKLLWDLGAFILPQNGTGSVTFRVSID